MRPERDRTLLCFAAGLRATAAGLSGVLLALHLAQLGFGPGRIGVAVSLGLGGIAAGSFWALRWAERVGRRRTLVVVGLLLAAGGVAFALSTRPFVLLAAACFGMVNGMGRDRGPGLTVDQTILPQTVAAARRTWSFAWYNAFVDAGHALGGLLAGLPAWLRSAAGMEPLAAARSAWALYAAICFASALLAWMLSPQVEPATATAVRPQLSPASRRIVGRFAALSALDSLGGGFLTSALVGYWFFRRFGVDESLLGPLFAAARIANGLSHFGAAWLAKRIGLVRTMVWTHLPSSLLLATVPWAPDLTTAIVLFLIRESLVEMDVPTRQSYIVAVVAPEERLAAAGITNLTRSVAWSVAPACAGVLMRVLSLGAPLLIGPGLKITYDVLLWRAFRHLPPPEERAAPLQT